MRLKIEVRQDRERVVSIKGVIAMKKTIQMITVVLFIYFLLALIVGCGPAVVVRQPPSARIEVKPAKPYTNAVWINGHWKWNRGSYVWIPGFWSKPKPGKKWISGHWAKRPKGWIWIKGHWR